MNILNAIGTRLKGKNLYSQETKKDPIVYAKLFDCVGSATWYITEYDPDNRIAFAYVEALTPEPYNDEWGYVALDELQALTY